MNESCIVKTGLDHTLRSFDERNITKGDIVKMRILSWDRDRMRRPSLFIK
jgi:hypothetical protein